MNDDERRKPGTRSGDGTAKPGRDESSDEGILRCRVGRRSGRVVLGHDRLFVESDDEGFETKSFLLDESLQMQEKFGKESVSVELQQDDEWVRAWKMSRADYNRLEARVADAKDSGARPAAEETPSPAPLESVQRHEPVATVAANLWEEITGSPGHAQKGPQVTVHAGPDELFDEDEGRGRSGESVSVPRRGDPLSLILAAGLLVFVLHSFWVGFHPSADGEMRRARRGDERAVRELALRLADEENLAARVAIVETLSLSGGPEVRSALIHGLLRRDEPYYRRITVQALTRLRVGNEIVGALSEDVPVERRRRLLHDLAAYGGAQVIPALQTAYASTDVVESLKGEVALALARLGDTAPLAARLGDGRTSVAGEAIRLALTLEPARLDALFRGLPRPLPVAAVEGQVAAWLERRPAPDEER